MLIAGINDIIVRLLIEPNQFWNQTMGKSDFGLLLDLVCVGQDKKMLQLLNAYQAKPYNKKISHIFTTDFQIDNIQNYFRKEAKSSTFGFIFFQADNNLDFCVKVVQSLKYSAVTRNVPLGFLIEENNIKSIEYDYDALANYCLIIPDEELKYQSMLFETLDFWLQTAQLPLIN